MTTPPRLIRRLPADPQAERASLVAALRAPHASIAPKYFYDPAGCALFAAICELPEYYPTRTEQSIFATHRGDIARVIGARKQLVDLGAGDGAKAAAWFDALRPSRYVAVDIAGEEIETALGGLATRYPEVEMLGIVADFTQGLAIDDLLGESPATFFYPGSSIGNFKPNDAAVFIADVAALSRKRPGSGLLIGVDTIKDAARLTAAYDDAQGITAAFNRNVLRNVNRVAGTDFDAEAFIHRARYDTTQNRIEMYLESSRAQVVMIDGSARSFSQGERIHTENSYKYAPADFSALLSGAGFTAVDLWQDPARDFAVYYAR